MATNRIGWFSRVFSDAADVAQIFSTLPSSDQDVSTERSSFLLPTPKHVSLS